MITFNKKQLQAVLINCLGLFTQGLEFAIFSFSLPKIKYLFFSPNASQYLTWLVYSVSYVARPVSSWIYANVAAKFGNTSCLIISSFCSIISPLIILITPTYKEIGILATVLIILSRIVISFAKSGEFPGNFIYYKTNFEKQQRNILTALSWSFCSFGCFIGMILIRSFINNNWKMLFIIQIPIALLTKLFRLRDYKNQKQKKETQDFNQIEEIKRNWSIVQKSYFGGMLSSGSISIAHVWWFAYVINQKIFTEEQATLILTMQYLICIPICMLSSFLAEKLGRNNVIQTGCVISLIGALSVFPLSIMNLGFYTMLAQATIKYMFYPTLLTEIIDQVKQRENLIVSVPMTLGDITGSLILIFLSQDNIILTMTILASIYIINWIVNQNTAK